MGSAVELGAFIQNNKLEQKLTVCINQKFARDKSFIMMGPVKHLKKINKTSVMLYKEDKPELLGTELTKKFIACNAFHKREINSNPLTTYLLILP